MQHPTRMAAVQTPIIPVVGQLIRENPGTISLGQGVVNYGPPQESNIPGSTFGINKGCYLRVAFGALEKHTVEDGIDRLVNGLQAICK